MIPALFSVGLAAQPVRLALVVTTNEGLRSEESLRYADSDGDQVAEVLVELGSFDEDHVVRVRDATRSSLEAGLSEVVVAAAELGSAGAEVDLLVYYTGHGGEDGLHLAGEVMPLAELKAAARVVPAHRRVFVVDACQSGQLMRSKGAVLSSVGDQPRGFVPPPRGGLDHQLRSRGERVRGRQAAGRAVHPLLRERGAWSGRFRWRWGGQPR